ncbi:MAG: hypothetical protein ABWY35_03895 [Pseudorhodoplanes sp.]
MSSKTLILCAALLAGALAAWPVASRAADDELSRMLDEFSSADQGAGHNSGTACLTPAQRRHIAASGKVVPLSKAIRAARARKTEVVDAKLCKSPKGLVYLLTLLAQDGKVTRVAVDAASGKLSDGG